MHLSSLNPGRLQHRPSPLHLASLIHKIHTSTLRPSNCSAAAPCNHLHEGLIVSLPSRSSHIAHAGRGEGSRREDGARGTGGGRGSSGHGDKPGRRGSGAGRPSYSTPHIKQQAEQQYQDNIASTPLPAWGKLMQQAEALSRSVQPCAAVDKAKTEAAYDHLYTLKRLVEDAQKAARQGNSRVNPQIVRGAGTVLQAVQHVLTAPAVVEDEAAVAIANAPASVAGITFTSSSNSNPDAARSDSELFVDPALADTPVIALNLLSAKQLSQAARVLATLSKPWCLDREGTAKFAAAVATAAVTMRQPGVPNVARIPARLQGAKVVWEAFWKHA